MPSITVDLTFDILMNTSVVPDDESFELKIDGIQRDIGVPVWQSPTVLRLLSLPGDQPLVDVTLELLNADPGLISTLSKQVQPFGPIEVDD